MRVRIESVAEHWAQRPGNRRTANCLAGSGLVSPAVRSERTADSRLPSVRDGERPVLVPRGASSRNPTASDPLGEFCFVRDFVVRATATRAHLSVDPSTDGKVVVCLVAPGGRES